MKNNNYSHFDQLKMDSILSQINLIINSEKRCEKRSVCKFDVEKFVISKRDERIFEGLKILDKQMNKCQIINEETYNLFYGFLIFNIQQYDIQNFVISSLILLKHKNNYELRKTINRFIKSQKRDDGSYGYSNPLMLKNDNDLNHLTTSYFVFLKGRLQL